MVGVGVAIGVVVVVVVAVAVAVGVAVAVAVGVGVAVVVMVAVVLIHHPGTAGLSRTPCRSAARFEMADKPLTKTARTELAGNSVCPPVAAALVAANA